MTEIRCLSLFAGIGVAEAYFEDIGINVRLANEIVPKRAQFYGDVYPQTRMICGDITDDDIRIQIINEAKKEKVNFIIATPPCQGMSVAGNRDPDDVRNQLIYYAIDVIKHVSPRFVLLENVPRQIKTKITVNGKKITIPDYIMYELGNTYCISGETLVKAKDYGVPQLRERNIYLLVRKDIGITWNFPPKQREISLQEAIGKLPSLDPYLREGLDLTLEKFPEFELKKSEGEKVSKLHRPPSHPWRQVEWMQHTPSGKSAIFNEKFFPQKKDGTPIKAHHNHYRRMSWDKPARTVTMFNSFISTLCTVHPGREFISGAEILYSDPRALSIYELLIVMSLPTNWNIPDWADEPFLRAVIGEGIPSNLSKELMLELIRKLREEPLPIVSECISAN